jgi:hypothetical protein
MFTFNLEAKWSILPFGSLSGVLSPEYGNDRFFRVVDPLVCDNAIRKLFVTLGCEM